MANGYTIIAVAISIFVAAALLVNTRTTLGQQKGTPPTDTIMITVNLKPHENASLAKGGYYRVSTWSMNASKSSTVCPSGDCQYSFENTAFSPISYTGVSGYSLEGVIKVSVVTNDTINSKFYPIYAEFHKTASQEKKGQTTEFLQGRIGFGQNHFIPDFEYKVDNGTLLVNPSTHVLTVQGVKK
jgi:hypothetical protein